MTKFEKLKTFTIDEMAEIFIMTVTTANGMKYVSLFSFGRFDTKKEAIEFNKKFLESEATE